MPWFKSGGELKTETFLTKTFVGEQNPAHRFTQKSKSNLDK